MNHKSPIAIVGMSCRFPGGIDTPENYWNFLCRGADAISAIGPDRWATDFYYHPNPKTPGRSHTWSAGVVNDIDKFDAEFFGISPREAAEMDPQQRILLELAWEALEEGAQVPRRLAGSQCGVYVGISSTDFGTIMADDPASGGAYVMTGSTLSIAANRISYVFDLHGPSMAIDTACSSALVAVHQACQSIWNGESSAALAGGMHVLLNPFPFIGFSNASMLAADGRCRAFDAAGSGYVRSEGGALVYLKPLEAAEADGDPIHAVIVASATNSDGRTRGLAMPNLEAQRALLKKVYGNGGIDPCELDYIEAHGTGTAVGDPVEAAAIGDVLGKARPADDPVTVGSVKTNVGHLEPASGMAGLLKIVCAAEKRYVPPSLNFDTPNPHIPFGDLNLRVATEGAALGNHNRSITMGVNSFGFGGSNAHVVIRAWESRSAAVNVSRAERLPPLLLSARSEPALRAMASSYARYLQGRDETATYDSLHTAFSRRERHNLRLAALAPDHAGLIGALREFGSGKRSAGVVTGEAVSDSTRVAFAFSGNGSQWVGMGRRLLAENPVFRRRVVEVNDLLKPHVEFSLLDELMTDDASSRMHRTEIAQPLLFALQVGILEVLLRYGLTPDAVFGHSVGEVAAAYASGGLSLQDAAQVIVHRSAAQSATFEQGRMAAVGIAPDALREILDDLGSVIELAAVNSPRGVTVSGPQDALNALGARCKARKISFRFLDIQYPFHSAAMDPLRGGLLRRLAHLRPRPARTPFVSTVSGEITDGAALDAGYWWHNVRMPVRLDLAVGTLLARGIGVFVEIGPQPVMRGYVTDNARAANHTAKFIATLSKKDDGADRLECTLLEALVAGVPVDGSRHFPVPGRATRLPPYPWQRERYWFPTTTEANGMVHRRRAHPLLGYPYTRGGQVWENLLDTWLFPYLKDHEVGGATVFPAAGYAEMALAAARETFGGERLDVDDLEIRAPLVLSDALARTTRFRLDADGRFEISSRVRLSEDAWTVHAVGQIANASHSAPPAGRDLKALIGRPAEIVQPEVHYRQAGSIGLEYGPAFQPLSLIRVYDWGAVGELGAAAPRTAEPDPYLVHPSLLDACFQLLIDVFASLSGETEPTAYLPVRIGRVRFNPQAGAPKYAEVRVIRAGARSILADCALIDASGGVTVSARRCRFLSVNLAREASAGPAVYGWRKKLLPREDPGEGSPSPSPPEVARHIAGAVAKGFEDYGRSRYYDEVAPLLDAMICAYAGAAFRGLGVGGDPFSASALVSEAGVLPGVLPFVRRLLTLLDAEKIDEDGRELWRLPPEAGGESANDIWRALIIDHPQYLRELTMAGRVGTHLTDLLTGRKELAEIIEAGPGGTLDQLFHGSPGFRIVNDYARAAVREIVRQWPASRRIRVLEIGGGAGWLTPEVFDLLPSGRFDLVLASADDRVLDHHRERFGKNPDVDFAIWDGDEPLNGGLPGDAPFDLVICANPAYWRLATPATLDRIRGLMARNGLLLIRETNPEPVYDFVFGTDKSWWSAPARGQHRESRLLGLPRWRELLAAAGLNDIASVTEPVPASAVNSFLLLARNPDDTRKAGQVANKGGGRWVIFRDDEAGSAALASQLSRELANGEGRVVTVTTGPEFGCMGDDLYCVSPEQPKDFTLLLDALGDGEEPLTFVHLQGLGAAGPRAASERCASALHLSQALAGRPRKGPLRLWLVTRGGVPGETSRGSGITDPSGSALWGFARVLMNEHAELNTRLVDIAGLEAPAQAARLLEELRCGDGECEVVLDGQDRYVMRVDRLAKDTRDLPPAGDQPTPENCVLGFSHPGRFSHLGWRAARRRPPGEGEIEVRVHATGVNFRDIMYAMGLLPEEALDGGFAGPTLGIECAGDVVSVGPGVAGIRRGDAVFCFGSDCFARFVTTKATAAAVIPAGWSYEAAATVPTTCFTAYYALKHLAKLEPGERVLIHGGAGGVGLAAMQYAMFRGAEVFVTAGSDEKRDFLRLHGADHVLDSRSLAFADRVFELTQGEGVDVVLNCLSGEAMRKTLKVLKPFGRFLELGKRDFYENNRIGLRPLRHNISYFGIDADQLLMARPGLCASMFRELMQLFRQRVFHPLPHRVFPAGRVADAFSYMQQARHIGKVVVSRNGRPAGDIVQPARAQNLRLNPEASYLVTGGLSGFGLATARWLVDRGARWLILLGRTGASTREARAAVAAFENAGVRVSTGAVDVASRSRLDAFFRSLPAETPPLKGVIHAAMVLDDALIRDMTASHLHRVLRPKVDGAWNLHCLTEDQDLDFFVLYSSATTLLGSPGQSNYVAANTYLEALAEWRLRRGLPALAVCWGPIGDAGYLSRNDSLRETLARRLGGRPLLAAQALRALERLLAAGRTGLSIVNIDWRAVTRVLPAGSSAKFEALQRAYGDDNRTPYADEDILQLIDGLDLDEVVELVRSLLVVEIERVLRIPREKVDTRASVMDLGMDSLMGVELHTAVEDRFQIDLPVMAITEAASIESVAARIADHLVAADAAQGIGTAAHRGDIVSGLAAVHGEELEASDVEDLIRRMDNDAPAPQQKAQ